MLFTYLAALSLATAALAASGCGGSSKSGSTTGTTNATTAATTTAASTPTSTKAVVVTVATGKPLSHAQWVAQGDAICARLNAQLGGSPVKTIQEFTRELQVAAADEQAELAQLVKLVPPRSAMKDWKEFLEETREWAENSAKISRGAQENSGSISLSSPLVTETKKLHEHLAAIARHNGFTQCSIV